MLYACFSINKMKFTHFFLFKFSHISLVSRDFYLIEFIFTVVVARFWDFLFFLLNNFFVVTLFGFHLSYFYIFYFIEKKLIKQNCEIDFVAHFSIETVFTHFEVF